MVHDLAERISHGEEVDVPAHLVGYVDAAIRFLDDLDVQPVSTEQVVASVKHGYCGTFDLYADTNQARALFDYKTSKSGPYPEAALQLAAYRYAEWWLNPEGIAVHAPPINGTAVVWLQPDRYELYPTASGPTCSASSSTSPKSTKSPPPTAPNTSANPSPGIHKWKGGETMPFHSDIQPHLYDSKAYLAGLALVLFLMGRKLIPSRFTSK